MPSHTPENLKRALFVALAAACCLPAVGAPVGLALGIGFGISLGAPWPRRVARASKRLLQISVVGLGFGLGLGQVWQAGRDGVLYTVVGISGTIAAGLLLARLLRVRGKTGALISFGTAICGGSAIAAMAPVVDAEEGDIAVSLATVFTLNAVALFLFPWLGHLLGLTQRQFGFWAALAIHDTSSVVGAGSVYGAQALALATTVKLARAAWIAPLALATGWVRKSESRATLPWFIVGFIAAAALRSALPGFDPAWGFLFAAARQALVLTLFLVGATMTRDVLRTAGTRSLVHGGLLWLLVGGTTLLAVVAGILA